MGQRAAEGIDRILGNNFLLQGRNSKTLQIPAVLDQDENFFNRRLTAEFLSPSQWLKGFEQVELGLNEKDAVKEANRCLRCSLRLDL